MMQKFLLPILLSGALLASCSDDGEAQILNQLYAESDELIYTDIDSVGNFALKFQRALASNYDLLRDPLTAHIDSNIEYARECFEIGISVERDN